ncbi:histidine kinase [Sphingomonas sp. BIUV-7]|uniref:Histidine kinase n=2 Tax=Sphingomonas natans TaxID=3063330 RepID=A0ABT8Y9A5_9SPHN|nr:histidine kinase [Sphingomonas sp. BIUV-7]
MHGSLVFNASSSSSARRADRLQGGREDVQWREGLVATVALWSFTLLIYLPMIVGRYRGMGVTSVLLDCSTILVSMLFAMGLFALFRGTYALPRRTRLAVMIGAVLSVAIVQSAFDLLFTGFVAHNLEARWLTLPQDLRSSYGAALNYTGVFAVNCALFQVAAGRQKALRQERELAHLRATAKQAELDAMRLKFNPHFLFNTLNAISAMVVTDRNPEAEQGLETLSSFLRASIESDPMAITSLEDQLQLVDHYLQLEEMRFGERLAVTVECADDVGDVAVPSLLIQPLVEAAIRDGVEPSSARVQIRIIASRDAGALQLRVSDDAPRTQMLEASLAAEAIRGRLRALYGAAASVIVRAGENGVETTLRMPMAA